MSYGNMHHVEIIQHQETGKYKGEFVTMMQASHRARGIKSDLNPEGGKQSIIKLNHGDDWRFAMALHINDLVSVDRGEGEREFYRVQKIEAPNRLTLRLNTTSTIDNKNEEIRKSIAALMASGLKKHRMNSIGVLIRDD